ncbi:MAG: AmmeMemoRadiSam system protein B [Chloroflexi bacterium]|nr:AmmeMemoRadiSam system protein B [Chloroflexota bacterium]
MTENPTLRPLGFEQIVYQGQQMWYLSDPLKLTDYQLILPPVLAQMLVYCDGTRTPAGVHQALCSYLGAQIEFRIIEDALNQLDKACMLDNARSRACINTLRDEYRNQPHRPPALADLSYPGKPDELATMLENYSNGDDLSTWEPWSGRGIISPHIDYQRGGSVYAKVWQRAKTAVLDADLIIIFGTDHNGGPGTFTLTRQPYATPYGVLPTDVDLIDKIANAIGTDAAYAEELHHRQEHSVELTAVWLHHIYHQAGVAPKPMIPILVGSFQHFTNNGNHPAKDEMLTTAIDTLKAATAGKKVLAVASVDFAHVGPTFGDHYLMNQQRRDDLRQTDDFLVQSIIRGDAAGFYNQLATIKNSNRVCGFSPIYLMLQYLGTTEGVQVAYDQCTADEQDTSLVSIAGILLE